MNTKGAFWVMALLLCLASVSGRKLLDVQVQAPGTSVSVTGGSHGPSQADSASKAQSTTGSAPASPKPCSPVSVTAPFTNVQVPCSPSPDPAKSNSSPSPSASSVTKPAVNVQVPGYASVQVGRKM